MVTPESNGESVQTLAAWFQSEGSYVLATLPLENAGTRKCWYQKYSSWLSRNVRLVIIMENLDTDLTKITIQRKADTGWVHLYVESSKKKTHTHTKETKLVETVIRVVVTRGRGRGELGEGGRKTQTSSCEVNQSWGVMCSTAMVVGLLCATCERRWERGS